MTSRYREPKAQAALSTCGLSVEERRNSPSKVRAFGIPIVGLARDAFILVHHCR
jgi:hypothetical protein